jgi:hypothetical protein
MDPDPNPAYLLRTLFGSETFVSDPQHCFLPKKLKISTRKYWFGIRKKSRGLKGTGSATLQKRYRIPIRNTDNSRLVKPSHIFNNKPFVDPVLELGDLLLVLRGAGDSGPGNQYQY